MSDDEWFIYVPLIICLTMSGSFVFPHYHLSDDEWFIYVLPSSLIVW